MQVPPACHVAIENACPDRPSAETISGTLRTHMALVRCGCAHGFSVHRIDGIVCRTYCIRIVVRRDESNDADSKRCPSKMFYCTRCTGMAWLRPRKFEEIRIASRFRTICGENSPFACVALSYVIVEVGSDCEATIAAGAGAFKWLDTCRNSHGNQCNTLESMCGMPSLPL